MADASPEPGVYEVTSVEPEAEKAPTLPSSDSESEGAGRAILSALGLAVMILVIGLLGLVRWLGWGGVAIAAGVLVGAAVLAKTTLGKTKTGGARRSKTSPGGPSRWRPGGAGGGGRFGGKPKSGTGRSSSSPLARLGRAAGLGRGKPKAAGAGGRGSKAGGASGATQKGRLGRLLPLGRGRGAGGASQGGSKRGRLGGRGWTPASLRRKGKASGGSAGGSASRPLAGRGKQGKAKGSRRRARRWLTLGLPLAWAAWRDRGKTKASPEAEEGSEAEEPRQTANQRLAALLQEAYQRAELKTRGLGGRIRGWLWEPRKAVPETATQPEAAAPKTATVTTPGGPSGNAGGGSTKVELNNSNPAEVPDGMLDYRSFLVDEAAWVEEAAARATVLHSTADTELPVADSFRDVVGEYAAAWAMVAEMGAELVAEFGSSHETEIGRLESPRVNEQLWDTNNNDA